jgi:hypothetical protein
MMHMTFRAVAIAALIVAAVPARAAEESGSDLLNIIGTFVKDGLGPARTAEDLFKEDRQRLQAKPAKPAETTAEVAPPVKAEPVRAALAEPVRIEPAVDAPIKVAVVKVAPVAAQRPVPRKIEPVAVPPARPVAAPPPEAKTRPATIHVAPSPPPEPVGSRIAATATLDQAMRLGGAASLYSQRIRQPVRN